MKNFANIYKIKNYERTMLKRCSMHKKGIVGVGPALLFVNFFALITSVGIVIGSLALASGLIFRKKVREMSLAQLFPRIIIFISLTVFIISGVHIISGPTSNLYVSMLFGAIAFLIISTILSINSIKEEKKTAFLTLGILTLLFLFIAEVSVFIATKW
jgi:hypothetical protein